MYCVEVLNPLSQYLNCLLLKPQAVFKLLSGVCFPCI
jgi:hypothetical protein